MKKILVFVAVAAMVMGGYVYKCSVTSKTRSLAKIRKFNGKNLTVTDRAV